jgi:hypothetical protein
MKITFLLLLTFCLFGVESFAQFDFTPDSLVVTTVQFEKRFPTVWKAVRQAIKDKGCAIESEKHDEENTKGNIRTEACVFVDGEDSSRDVMLRYGKVPMIRGGVWVSGRAQYNFKIKEIPGNKVEVIMTVELSGKEDYITHLVHFWNSNGILDQEMMDRLKAILAAPDKKN